MSWLHDVVVINESADVAAPGDVSLFISEADALRSLEAWWVEEQRGFVFAATGERLVLGVRDDYIVAERREPYPEGKRLVLTWLSSCARALLEARKDAAEDGWSALAPFEERGDLPDTVEGLIAYIGFDRSPNPRTAIPTWAVLGLFGLAVALVFVVGGLLFAALGYLW